MIGRGSEATSGRSAAASRREPGARVRRVSKAARTGAGAPRRIEGALDGSGLKIAIVASRFNEFLGDRLLAGALAALEARGVRPADLTIVRVPGAFEIPTAAAYLARSRRYDAVIGIGAVLRGETPHFEWVAGEAARGVARIGIETGVPVLFGVLTTNTMEQALDRSGGKLGNRGADAALAAIEMARLARTLRQEGRS